MSKDSWANKRREALHSAGKCGMTMALPEWEHPWTEYNIGTYVGKGGNMSDKHYVTHNNV